MIKPPLYLIPGTPNSCSVSTKLVIENTTLLCSSFQPLRRDTITSSILNNCGHFLKFEWDMTFLFAAYLLPSFSQISEGVHTDLDERPALPLMALERAEPHSPAINFELMRKVYLTLPSGSGSIGQNLFNFGLCYSVGTTVY